MAAKKPGAQATVTLKHLAASLAETHEMSKKQTEAVLGDLVGLVSKHLKKGDRIRIGGLGILVVRNVPPAWAAIRPPAPRSRSRRARRWPSAPPRSSRKPSDCSPALPSGIGGRLHGPGSARAHARGILRRQPAGGRPSSDRGRPSSRPHPNSIVAEMKRAPLPPASRCPRDHSVRAGLASGIAFKKFQPDGFAPRTFLRMTQLPCGFTKHSSASSKPRIYKSRIYKPWILQALDLRFASLSVAR